MSKKLQLSLLTSGLTIMANISSVFADASTIQLRPPDSVTSSFSITSIGEFISAILSLLFIIAGILVFVYLVWGGLQWLTSGGDKAATQAARDRITAALVGLAIIAVAYAITIIVEAFFGVNVTGEAGIPTPFTP